MYDRKFTLIAVPILLAVAFAVHAEEGKKPSTYEALKSILSRGGRRFSVKPRERGHDLNLIDPEKGAGGVRFGQTLDEVMAVWGKPCGITITLHSPTWDFMFGGSRFKFFDNRLVSISIHNVDLPAARFSNGIGFESTLEEVEKAFGKPVRSHKSVLFFESENGYEVRCQFMAKSFTKDGKPELIVIEITQPESDDIEPPKRRKSPTYVLLRSLVKKRRWGRAVRIGSGGKDPNRIDPEKGAGGVTFGQSLDEVIEVWGKLSAIQIWPHTDEWRFSIQSSTFDFVDNKLVTIGIHCVDLEEASLENGISFRSSPEDVRKVYGKPIEERRGTLLFETKGGCRIDFHFIPGIHLDGKPQLIAIQIMHPGFD